MVRCSMFCTDDHLCLRTPTCLARTRIGAAPQIGALIARAPVSRPQGKRRQSVSRLLARRADRAATTLDDLWVFLGIIVVLSAFASRHAGRTSFGHRVIGAGHAGALIVLVREAIERVLGAADAIASRAPKARGTWITFLGARQLLSLTEHASFASRRGRAANGAIGAHRAHGRHNGACTTVIPSGAHPCTPWARLT